MMPLTWMAIVGLAIKVGIDVARYAGLRAERRADDAAPWRPADKPRPSTDERTSGFLVCHWHVDDRLAGKDSARDPQTPNGRRPLVCHWTLREKGSKPVKCEVLQLIRPRPPTVTVERTQELVD